jgi:hypothetical protein
MLLFGWFQHWNRKLISMPLRHSLHLHPLSSIQRHDPPYWAELQPPRGTANEPGELRATARDERWSDPCGGGASLHVPPPRPFISAAAAAHRRRPSSSSRSAYSSSSSRAASPPPPCEPRPSTAGAWWFCSLLTTQHPPPPTAGRRPRGPSLVSDGGRKPFPASDGRRAELP